MSYIPRIKIPGHKGGYHIVSRNYGRQFLCKDFFKDYFVQMLHKLKKLYFVRIVSYTIMENHYHLLVRFCDGCDVDAEEAMDRWNRYHEETPYVRDPESETDRLYVVGELTDVSSFMKRFNMLLTFEYNRRTGNIGTMWESSFYSSVVERGFSFVRVGAYIELNGFRGGVVEYPEDYTYNSFNYVRRGNRGNVVDTEILKHTLFSQNALRRGVDTDEFLLRYLVNIYESGKVAHRDEHGVPEKDGIVITEKMMMTLRERGHIMLEEGEHSERKVSYLEGKACGSDEFRHEIIGKHYDVYGTGTAERLSIFVKRILDTDTTSGDTDTRSRITNQAQSP